MHGHDGCGCGHAHGEEHSAGQAQQVIEGEQVEQHVEEAQMQGCGDGCGCASAEPSALQLAEVAALRGFLSGLYASRLGRAELAEYLDQMGRQDGSEFQQPALFLAQQLAQVPEGGDGPAAWKLLDAVAGEDGEGPQT